MTVRSLFLEALKHVQYGQLTLKTPDDQSLVFQGQEHGPSATFSLSSWNVLDNVIFRGDIGLAQDYILGNCYTDNLPELLAFATHNASTLERFFHGKFYYVLMYKLTHWMRGNTLKGSQRNIEAHYDLGNDFYALWLDPSMTYSSAIYQGKTALSLEQAQRNKYQRILEQFNPGTSRCLEIGSGWGGFAKHAAFADHHVTGLSLSPKQIGYCNQMIQKDGLSNNINIKHQDYRHESGQYDHIVSIEMFEAVGQKYWLKYFDTIKRCLKPKGTAIIQVITIAESVFAQYAKRCDFIQKYIFPGGCLPAPSRFEQAALRSGLSIQDSFTFGQDYHMTLGEWLKRFDTQHDQVLAMGFDQYFIRKWQFYLAYCMAGFSNERTNVVQYTLRHTS